MLRAIQQTYAKYISPNKKDNSVDKMMEEEDENKMLELFRRPDPDGKPMVFTSTMMGKEKEEAC